MIRNALRDGYYRSSAKISTFWEQTVVYKVSESMSFWNSIESAKVMIL